MYHRVLESAENMEAKNGVRLRSVFRERGKNRNGVKLVNPKRFYYIVVTMTSMTSNNMLQFLSVSDRLETWTGVSISYTKKILQNL